ncbi:MAG TPA: hypothetical protein VKZ55_12620 [Microthrixaceae bacterium]|nr:hypothetical protein [Microthrixaceae bacterium]
MGDRVERRRTVLARLAPALLVPVLLASACVATRTEQAAEERPVGARPVAELGPRRALSGAVPLVVDGEVWVAGGLSGPDGSKPPTSSELPEDWSPNELITAYDAQGRVLRQVRVRLPHGQALFPVQVLARGERRVLIGNLCAGGVGCAGIARPVVVRIEGDSAEVVELDDLPVGGVESGAGLLSVIGLGADGSVWATQRVGSPGMPGLEEVRLVALDPDAATATEVASPAASPLFADLVCLAGDRLVAADVRLEAGAPVGVRLLQRAATTDAAEWEVLGEPPLDLARVTGGRLHCPDDRHVVVDVAASRSTTLRTLSSSTGELVGEPFEVPGNEVHLLGHLEDGTPVASARDGDRLRYLTFEDGAWILSGTTTPFGGPFDWPRPRPVVVDGRVRDVRALLGSTHPRDVELPVIEL